MAKYVVSKNKTCLGLYVKRPTFLSHRNKILRFSTDSHKSPNTKFHENTPNENRANTDRWKNMTRLKDASRTSENALRKSG